MFNNHKNGDFKPYVLKSSDRGATWTSISSDLPERGSVYTIAEDHVKADLLFVGTEFGVHTTVDGGKSWLNFSAGLPTIGVRDMEIQRRENDLVLGTFGRGFYVLDDYSPLRELTEEALEQPAQIFPIKDALIYNQARPLVYGGKGFQGESFFNTPNPEVGAVITYYLKEAPKSLKSIRKDAEKKAEEDGTAVSYPDFDALRAEDDEQGSFLLFTFKDAEGNIVARKQESASAGMHRLTWAFRYPDTSPVSSSGFSESGPQVLPGTYTVEMHISTDGEISKLVDPVSFEVVPLNNSTLPAADKAEVLAFLKEAGELGRVMWGTDAVRRETADKLEVLKNAIKATPEASIEMLTEIRTLETRLTAVNRTLNGDRSVSSREFETLPGLTRRVSSAIYGIYGTTAAPTEDNKMNLEIARKQFGPVYQEMQSILEAVSSLEDKLEEAGSPALPGRLPEWDGE